MGMTTQLNLTDGAVMVAINAAKRRGLLAGGEVILAASDALAPKEPIPKHDDINMVDTGFVKLGIGIDGIDYAVIGYEAWWSIFPHEDLEAHHPNGGEAKFLEKGAIEAEKAAYTAIASSIASELGI